MSLELKEKKRSVTINECKKILGEASKHYSDEQLQKIMDWLYQLAKIEHTNYIEIKNEKKSNSLHKGFHRRTSRKGL
jgi:hypothetical protein